jgi:2-dehydropantoate 2-reductase
MKSINFSKIFVLGAGAIGSVYGALLSQRNDVTLIGKKAHVNAVNSKGLSISGDVNKVFHLRADTEIHETLENTLVILTTKAYDSVKAIKGIKNFLKKNTVILILQNGLENEKIISVVGDEVEILRGITAMAAEFFEPGKIRFWSGETIIKRNEVAERIAKVFNGCMLKTSLSDDISTDIWNKLIVNCAVNPLSAIFQVKNNEIAANSLKTVRHKIVRECINVGKAEGISFPADLEEKIDREISSYTNFSSMCQDVMKNRRTEIDFLNGKIVELGRKHHIPTTVNETIVCLVKFLEEKHGISGKNQAKEG